MILTEEISYSENITCCHDLSVKHRSGVTIISAKPLFTHDFQNVIIANGPHIKVFSVKSGECTLTMKYHTTSVIGLQENKNNMLQIYSCSSDGMVVRWDYTGRVLQVCNLGMPVVCFYAPYPENKWFITKKYEDQYRLYSLVPKSDGDIRLHLIQRPVQPQENTIDFSSKHKFLASVYGNKLVVYLLDSRTIKGHLTGERKLTCVACHPTEPILATGDDQGRVLIWSDALHSNRPIKSTYHWHNLPVADLAFTPDGYYIYSGGGECALVKWNLFSSERPVLPRLGAPIERIVVAKDNSLVITTHSDNVLQVISAQRDVVQVIQGLTRSFPFYEKVLPVGLLYNAHLKTLVMNGKPGHLQFFDLQQGKLMFNLDIASRNFMSQERDQSVCNIDVHKAAMDDAGLWLAASEYWCNGEVSPHIWMKFWEYDLEKQMFVLNTNVYMPHNKDLNCIVFKPLYKDSDDTPLVVTTSNDGCFKLWTLNTIPHESKQSWGCEFVGQYRDLVPGSATFSQDGSVLAVAFGPAATLWMINSLTLKAVLYQRKSQMDIKQLLFGRHAGFKYLVGHNEVSITVWDCSLLCIHFIIHYDVQTLVADPFSDNIAAFCKDQNLKIFKPNSPQPLDYIRKVSDSPIVSAVFVPSATCNNIPGCFKDKSQLYFVDANQNLLTVSETDEDEETIVGDKNLLTVSETDEDEETIVGDKRTVPQHMIETPFGLLQAQQTISSVQPAKVEQFNVSTKKEVKIISNPTWQDPEALLKAILPNLLIKEEDDVQKETMTQTESHREAKERVLKSVPAEMNRDEEWLSKSLKNLEIKHIDFSFLTENVKFKT